jgi:hypothetical protein
MSILKAIKNQIKKGWKRRISGLMAVVITLSLLAGLLVSGHSRAATMSSTALGQIDKWMIDESSGYIYATTSDSMKLLFISLADLQVKKQISYLSAPTDLAADNGKLYLPLSGTTQISVVDAASQSVVNTVYTSNGNPYRIAVDGNSLYYVLQNSFSFITSKDLTTNAEAQFGSPDPANSYNQPSLALDKSAHMLYVAESGISGGHVVTYDTVTKSIVTSNKSTYDEGYGFAYPKRIVVTDGADVFYAGHRLDKTNLSIVKGDYYPDLSGQTEVYYAKGTRVFTDSAVFDRETYVKTAQLPYTTTLSLMDTAGNIYLFNPVTMTIDKMMLNFVPTNIVTSNLNDNKLSINATVTKMVYSSQTGNLYAISPTFNKLLTINPVQMSIIRQTNVGSKPTDLALSGGKLYVSLYGATSVAVTDDVYSSGAVTILNTAETPRRLAVANGNIFYLPEFPGSGNRNLYVMPSVGGASLKVQYVVSANTSYYRANLLADDANHNLYIGETSSSPRYLYKMNTVPNAGKYTDPQKSAGLGATGEVMIQDGADLLYGDSRFDPSTLSKLNGSSLYLPEIIAVNANYVITKTAVYDRNSVGKLFDLPYTADTGLILGDGSVLLYSSAKGGLFRYSSVDEIKIPRDLASAVSFMDINPNTGIIKGTVSWTNPADTSYLTGFSLYFLDAQGIKIGDVIARVATTANSYTLDTTSVPAGAVRIGVFSYNQWAESVKCASALLWDATGFLASKLSFVDTNPAKGQIHGLLTWSPAANETIFSKYAIYFKDYMGTQIGNVPYALINNGQAAYSLEIPESDIPAGASTISILSMTNSGEMSNWDSMVRIADNIKAVTPSVASVTYGLTGVPTNPMFTDTNPAAGKISGKLEWKGLSTDVPGGSYKVYFVDASYKTVGSAAEVMIGLSRFYQVTFPSDTTLPTGAVYFGIVRKSASGVEDTNALIMPINDLGSTVPTPTPVPSSPTINPDPGPGTNPGTDQLPKPVVTTDPDGKVTVTLTITEQQLKDQLSSPSGVSTIKIQVTGTGSIMQSVFAGTLFQRILGSNAIATLETSTTIGSIAIRAAEIQKALEAFGQDISKVSVSISVKQMDSLDRSKLDSLFSGQQITLVSVPLDFRITATLNGDSKKYEITSTTSYVTHTIPLPATVTPDAIKTLTGVMYDPATNTYYPVPTVFTTNADGTIQATLNRLGNSIYTVVSTNHKTFGDVSTQHYAKDAIEALASKFVISGYEDNSFRTDQSVTRAEFASMLIKAMGIVPKKDVIVPFNDVNVNDWYIDAVAAAKETGFISGYEDGTFRPNETVSRQEMAIMINKALRTGGYDKQFTAAEQAAALANFSDRAVIPDWAKEAASYVSNTGIMNGTADGSFAGEITADRAQAAVILYRMLKTLHFIN